MPSKQTDVAVAVKSTVSVSGLNIHDPADTKEIHGIRVVDVGQGDCIGIVNQNDEVFCYVDFGGLADHPEKGINHGDPSQHRMPAQLKNGKHVVIILTHWDKDHFWSAKDKNSDAQNCNWIVPRQYVSPQGLLVARKLKKAKRWPDNIGRQEQDISIGSRDRVIIRKCGKFVKNPKKPDRNNTGLAITIVRSKNGKDDEKIILPGDCPFDRIPDSHANVPIRFLVAYHHGSRTDWDDIKTTDAIKNRASNHQMVYSYGSVKNWQPHRRKYGSHWDATSKHTTQVRGVKPPWIDCKW